MKQPTEPDPYATAQAQSQFNTNTAISQQLLNMTNQVNPWGSTTYSQNGMNTFTGADGKQYSIPQFTQTTTFTPEQQAIFSATQRAEGNLANMADEQSASLREYLSTPFEYTNRDAEMWAYDIAAPRILEQQSRDQTALRERLINSGLRPGTDAYNMEMTRMNNAATDQINNLALAGRQQGFSEALATRNQPINEITALLSGSQVSNPAQMSGATPQTSVGGVDYAGLVNNNYNQQMNAYQAKMGGLFGLLGAGIGAVAKRSDARLKTDITRVGTLDNGLPVYAYRYKAGGPTEIGLMAQDVERVNPEAVTEVGGYKAVDYGRAAL